jgi:hypothetical protein
MGEDFEADACIAPVKALILFRRQLARASHGFTFQVTPGQASLEKPVLITPGEEDERPNQHGREEQVESSHAFIEILTEPAVH